MAGCRNLTDNEINLIINELSAQRDKTLFILGLKTGFRITELLSIKIKHVYQFNRVTDTLRIERRNMKGQIKSRDVALHPIAKIAIEKLLKEFKELDDDMFLFKSRKGKNMPITRIQAHCLIKNAVNKLELQGQIATHSMRKSFANRVYKALNNDLRKLQSALGHSEIETTVKYLDDYKEEINEAILKI